MLTILIKAYCVSVVVDIKPNYLKKYYLFQNKIYYLDKIYFCFAIIKLFKHTITKEALAGSVFFLWILRNCWEYLFLEHLWATASKQVTVPLQRLQTAKSLISSCSRTGETILSNYWQNPKITLLFIIFIKVLVIIITFITFIFIVKCTLTIWKFY